MIFVMETQFDITSSDQAIKKKLVPRDKENEKKLSSIAYWTLLYKKL